MLKTLRVLLDQFEIADCVCCSVIALEGLAPGSDFDELRECMGLRAPAMRARVCERVVSLGASTVAQVGVASWPSGFLGKGRERKLCNPTGECKFAKVKAAEQNYD